MKKKFTGATLAAAMTAGFAGCGSPGDTSTGAAAADTQTTEAQEEEAKDDVKREGEKEDPEVSDSEGAGGFHISIITGSVSQFEDGRRGAEAFQAMYGEDIVKLTIYSDNLTEKLETTIQTVVSLSDDPKMEAIIVNQSVPGITGALRKIEETRPDILCIAGEGHEDLPEISNAADSVCNNDFIARGYLIIRTAHELSCNMFVHISLPRHMAYETMSRRVTVMKEACKESGMEFVLGIAPDPTSSVGVVGARVYTPEKVSEWVEKYGKNAVYFYINDAHTEPLLKQLMEYDGYFTEADLPSPLVGYPDALGTDLTVETGNFDKILAKVESTVVERGDADHFGTWVYPYGHIASADLAQHTLNVPNSEGELDDIDGTAKAYQVFSPKAKWSSSNYTNVETSVKLDNVLLVHRDTYITGDSGHFVGPTKIEVPEKYFTIK